VFFDVLVDEESVSFDVLIVDTAMTDCPMVNELIMDYAQRMNGRVFIFRGLRLEYHTALGFNLTQTSVISDELLVLLRESGIEYQVTLMDDDFWAAMPENLSYRLPEGRLGEHFEFRITMDERAAHLIAYLYFGQSEPVSWLEIFRVFFPEYGRE